MLNSQTLLIAISILTLIGGIALLLAWWTEKHMWLSLGYWCISWFLMGSGTALMAVRGSIPDWISYVVANVLLLLNLALLQEGISHFTKVPGRGRAYSAIIIFIYTFLQTYYTFLTPNLTYRMLLQFTMVILLLSLMIYTLTRYLSPAFGAVRIYMISVLTGYASWAIVAIWIALDARPNAGFLYLEFTKALMLVMMAFQCSVILGCFWMVAQKQRMQLLEQARHDLDEKDVELRKAEMNYRSIFENSIEGIFRVTREGHYSLVNPSMANILGYEKPEDVVSLESGINFKYLLSDDDAQSQHIERQIIRKDGTTIWASENIRVVRDDRGSILYFEGTMEDITQRKEAEEALRQSEERFSKAFHSSPCAKSIIHLPDFRVIDVNRRWQDMTGYSREDVIGRPQEDMNIWTVQQRQRVLEYLNRCSSFNNFDAVFRTKSGEERDTIWSGEIITLGGDTCLLGAAIDITERKKYEREMARLDRLYLVGEMAAGIGHEIRNPMTVVSGYLQLFREKDEFAAYKKRFTIMIEELDRANSIITEFLSLAKNRAVHFNKQSLNNIVAAMLPLIQAEASKHSQSVTLEMNDAPDLLLDGNEIRQIILNLARNGLEAMTANGVLTIRTYLDGKEVILAVHNEGPEIPPEILEKIGAPFFTTKDSGTGLGMAVCYSIASKHNASIRIETRPSGTTFFVCFKSQDDMPAAS